MTGHPWLKRCTSAVAVTALLAGCAMEYKKEEQAAQKMPLNCRTAEGDIRMLQGEKVHTAQQVGAGISMIVPVGLVAGVATGTEGTKYQVTTGEYNRILDDKIAEIKRVCHLS